MAARVLQALEILNYCKETVEPDSTWVHFPARKTAVSMHSQEPVMPFSMSQASLPVFEIGLAALSAALDKAQAFATAKKVDPAVLLNTRLAPDMFPLARQVQVATDQAKNGAARLAGVEPPRYDDTETTIDQLKTRIADTIAYLKTLDKSKIDASIDREITFPLGPTNKGHMTGADYLDHFVLPNFYFHRTAAYAILRHCGVDVCKRDFLGAIPMKMT
jgi:uncharacterized protein